MLFALPIGSALAVTSLAMPPQSVLLRYKFKPGVTRRYSLNMNMDMKMDMGARSNPMVVGMQMVMAQTVKSVAADGTATIASVMEKQATTMNGQPMAIPGAANATGKVTTMKMSPTGKVSGIGGAAAGGMSGMGMDPQSMQVGSGLPSGPVSPGSHWTSHMSMGKMGQITVQNTLNRIGSSGGSTIAYIHSTGVVDMSHLNGKGSPMPSGAKMTGSISLNIDMAFNATAGAVQFITTAGNLSMNTQLGAAPKGGAPSSMKMSGIQKMTMKLIQ